MAIFLPVSRCPPFWPSPRSQPARPSPRASSPSIVHFEPRPYGHGADFAGTIVLEEVSKEGGRYVLS
ncbi:hypothetical protein HMPREF3193_00882 [Bifidobacterium breve]|nr:hypothetical protein HMPREF1587_00387 [Bifidobacterium breve JCP7499]KWZ85717.1 hypothetical protein HMPREF3193_00882 [Bifidobacterium breve]